MQFLKEHLAPGNYEWNNDLVYNGDVSRRLFNRNNGEQLLFIINQYAAPKEQFDIEEGVKVQELIKNQLPVDAKSERSVLQWLNETMVA
ncbi:MAG TPA: hypothetical protein VGO58_00475 [Chitinophagaceae bacterium]|nr:hypothetical protein [Chitinophagaceae bacterium]